MMNADKKQDEKLSLLKPEQEKVASNPEKSKQKSEEAKEEELNEESTRKANDEKELDKI